MDAQKKRKKKRYKKNYLLRLLLLIALGVGVYYWLTSSFFDLRQVVVENNSYYTKEQIIAKSDAKMGQNIFGIKTNHMRDALLEDPYMKSARVKRSLPASVIITVEERSEAATIPYADLFVVIDINGLVLRKTNTELPLPLLLGMTIKTMEEGSPLEVEETSVLTGTLQMLEVMEDTDMFFKKIDISNIIIRAYVYDNLICQGTPENVMESMISGGLEKLLYELYTNGIERGIIYVGSDNYYSFNPMIE